MTVRLIGSVSVAESGVSPFCVYEDPDRVGGFLALRVIAFGVFDDDEKGVMVPFVPDVFRDSSGTLRPMPLVRDAKAIIYAQDDLDAVERWRGTVVTA